MSALTDFNLYILRLLTDLQNYEKSVLRPFVTLSKQHVNH